MTLNMASSAARTVDPVAAGQQNTDVSLSVHHPAAPASQPTNAQRESHRPADIHTSEGFQDIVINLSPTGSTSNSSSRRKGTTGSSPTGGSNSSSKPASRTHSFNLDLACKPQQQQQQQQQLRDQAGSHSGLLKSAEQAVSTRLLPPLLLLVMVSYIDRTNLSFASIQLSQDLQLSSTMYGVGSGVFFLAYALGQIPSNLLLLRFGGPTWLAAITIAWGATASAFALVRGPVSFIVLRLLLGLAESGSLPGTWYYISLFYPVDRTTVPYSLIETGITVSQVIAAPFAAGLLLLDGVAGLRGWQWLFLIEGLPALMLGCFIRYWLPTSVASANFLSLSQKEALSKALAAAAAAADDDDDVSEQATASAALLPETHHAGSTSSSEHSASEAASTVEKSDGEVVAGAAAAAAKDVPTERQSLLGNKHTLSDAADLHITVGHSPTAAAAVDCGQQGLATNSSSSGRTNWQKFVAVAKNRVVLYAGSWRILHDIPGNGILYWTPKIVQALLIAAGSAAAVGAGATTHSSSSSDLENKPHRAGSSSTGAYVVLLSAIPYAAASLFHLLNAWHSQKQGERRWHIGLTWLLGAVALLLLPAAAAGGLAAAAGKAEAAKTAGISTAASIAAFVLLTIAHVGINGANGVQTGLVAGSIVKQDKALGLALYNMIGNIGSFTGPVLIGVLHDATGGYVVAMVLLGLCLAASAAMVVRFRPEKLDRRLLLQGPTLS